MMDSVRTIIRAMLPVFAAAVLQSMPPADKNPFAVVFIDVRTINTIGDIPFTDRSRFVTVLRNLRVAKAKAVVVKFFLDEPGDNIADTSLANEIAAMPIFLQASVNAGEKYPNPFSSKAVFTNVRGAVKHIIDGKDGWLPRKEFAAACRTYGFVDYRGNPEYLPAIERYDGYIVRSLWLAIIEYMFGAAVVVPGKKIIIGRKELPLNEHNEIRIRFPEKDRIEALSFIDVLRDTFPHDAVKGKIVLLCYDGRKIGTVNTPVGTITVHRLFCYGLMSLYEQIHSAGK